MNICTKHPGVRVEWHVPRPLLGRHVFCPEVHQCPVCVLTEGRDFSDRAPHFPDDGVCSHAGGDTLVYCEPGVPCPLCAVYETQKVVQDD